jgi:hypothetical protein
MPCFERSPKVKLAIVTIRKSTILIGICWTNVIPNRVNSLVNM